MEQPLLPAVFYDLHLPGAASDNDLLYVNLYAATSVWYPVIMSLACRSVGLPGTAAILAGYYLHLDPYGHLHWSSPDALVGLAAAVPVALTGENFPDCMVISHTYACIPAAFLMIQPMS